MKLLLLHPSVAARSCEDCQRYLFDDRGAGRFGSVLKRGELPVLRPKGMRPPCGVCPKIPAGSPAVPESAVELTPLLRSAWAYYRECKAVGEFPNDPWVRRCAAVIRGAEEAAERIAQQRGQLIALEAIFHQVSRG